MKKYRIILLTSALSVLTVAALPRALRDKHLNAARITARCNAVVPRDNSSDGCSPLLASDGSQVGFECNFHSLAPDRWGKCFETTEKEFACKKDGKISLYSKYSLKKWSVAVAACKELDEKIERQGSEGIVIEVPVEVEPEPPQNPPASRAKRCAFDLEPQVILDTRPVKASSRAQMFPPPLPAFSDLLYHAPPLRRVCPIVAAAALHFSEH
jgi:hypothetical protein